MEDSVDKTLKLVIALIVIMAVLAGINQIFCLLYTSDAADD